MKSIGVKRTVDKMGRVVIPKEIRAQLSITNEKDSFEIYMEDDKVILKKYRPACIFCDSLIGNIDYKGVTICKNCIEKLVELKNSIE